MASSTTVQDQQQECLNSDLQTLVLQFHSVAELVRQTQAFRDPERILEEIATSVHAELAFERVGVWKWEAATRSFVGVHGAGVPPNLVRGLRIPADPAIPLIASAIHEGRSARLPLTRARGLAREIYAGLAEEPSDCLLVPLQSRGQSRCFRLRSDPRGCPKAEEGPIRGLALRMSNEQVHDICLVCPVFPVAGLLWADRGRSGRALEEDLLPLWFYLAQTDLLLEATLLFEELREAAVRDSLTGAHTRAYFFRQLEMEVERALRYGHQTAVVMIDLDRFHSVNERLGQRGGDDVLARVAQALRAGLRRIDLVARYAGDGFVLILPHVGREGARVAVDRLRRLVGGMDAGPAGDRLSFSAGIAIVPSDCPEAEGLVGLADYAMHRAKKDGGGKTVPFGEEC